MYLHTTTVGAANRNRKQSHSYALHPAKLSGIESKAKNIAKGFVG